MLGQDARRTRASTRRSSASSIGKAARTPTPRWREKKEPRELAPSGSRTSQRKLPELSAARPRRRARSARRPTPAPARRRPPATPLGRERDALAARVEALGGELAAARAAADAAASKAPGREAAEEMERAVGRARRRAGRRATSRTPQVERLRAEREQDRRTIAELTRTLARRRHRGRGRRRRGRPRRGRAAGDRAGGRRACRRASPATCASRRARSRPRRSRRSGARASCCGRCARWTTSPAATPPATWAGRSSRPPREHGITQYKHDVAETTRKRYEDDYSFTLRRASKLWVGPHIGLGSGSGAGFVARIYLHVADGSDPEVPRGDLRRPSSAATCPDTTT